MSSLTLAVCVLGVVSLGLGLWRLVLLARDVYRETATYERVIRKGW